MPRQRKYTAENLMPMFRLAAKLRNEMNAAGFPDNGGAIHGAERILDILSVHLKYPDLSHINNYRKMPYAEFSVRAWEIYNEEPSGEVLIEHISPIRDFTRKVIEKATQGATDEELKNFIIENYRLVLLTPAETKRLNKQNHSTMDCQRLEKAEIVIAVK